MAPNGNNSGFFAQRRWLVWAGIIVAVVVLTSFLSRDDSVPVRAAAVASGVIRSTISTNGKIEPVVNFEAHAPVGTTVKKTLVKEGDHVKRGQLLVQLDDGDARTQAARALAQVRTAQADLSAVQNGGNREEVLTVEADLVKARAARDTAQRNLEALRRLQQNGAASPGEVKEAENQLARTEADLKLLQQKQKDRYSQPEVARVNAQKVEAEAAYSAAVEVLNQMNIRAPFDGIVYSLPVRQGAYLNPGDLVLQEADLAQVLVRTFVDEPDVGRLAPKQKIELTWDAMPGRKWVGSVSSIPASVKLHGTRNVGELTCIVDNKDLVLLPNVNVGVTIVTAEHPNALTIPREALRMDDKSPFVYQIVNDKEIQRRDIKTSIADLTQVEVISGLSQGDKVALAPVSSRPLRNGLAVRVVK